MRTPFSEKAVVDLLSSLIACPSVNPGTSGRTDSPYGEARLCEMLEKQLRGWGARVTLQTLAPSRTNLVAEFPGVDPSRRLMFEAHGDTVAPEASDPHPFESRIQHGRLHGRGACDTKGAMAAMLLGLRAVLDTDGRPPVTVYFATTADEEMSGAGAAALAQTAFRPDAVVVGEPTDLSLIHAHKGSIRWHVQTSGVSAHSSAPERGVNAIHRMCRVLDMIENEIAPDLATRRHPLLGPATINVGTIRGGMQDNIVPAHCDVDIDRRTLPSENTLALTAEFRRRLDALSPEGAGFASVDLLQFYPPLDISREAPICRLAERAMTRALGEARWATAPWASNAGVFQAAGIPSLLFGPGSIAQAHTADEFVALADVAAAAAVYEAIVRAAGDPDARLC